MYIFKSIFKALPLLLCLMLGVSSAFAATITVTNGLNTGAGSLRTAIASAASGDIIVFSGVSTVNLTSAELLIDKNLTISGGGGVTINRAGGTEFRLFNITSGTVTFNNLTFTNGNAAGTDGGGAVTIAGGAAAIFNTCVLTGNSAQEGGAIGSSGNVTMTNCTVDDNSTGASTLGGGLLIYPPANVVLTGCTISNNTNGSGGAALDFRGGGGGNTTLLATNCTISGNSQVGYISPNAQHTSTLLNCTITDNGIGISNFSGTITLKNSIVADNAGASIDGNVSASSSYNLIGVDGAGGLSNGVNNNQVGVLDAGLLALASNGGLTKTHALSPCSPAINTGTNSGAPSTDQRGSTRPFGGTTDKGSYELQSAGGGSISITSAITNVACFGGNNGSINLTVTGATAPLTYVWSGTGSGTDPRTNLTAGTYSVTVTDAAGCTKTHSATVTQPAAMTINKSTSNVTCNGGTNGSIDLTVNGGTSPFSYNWSGTGTGTNPRTGLAAGTYTVTVTDLNSCTVTNSTTVTQPSVIVVSGMVTNVSCFGTSTGAINLTVSGGTSGYSYAWSGTGTGTDPRTNLAAGTYTVTVTDANMCTKTNSFTVTQPGSGITIVPTVINATCGASNGSISLVLGGGNTPYSYNWSGTGTGTNPRTALAVGTYTVTVTDGNGCSTTNSATVVESATAVTILKTVTNVTCNGGTNGSIDLMVSGGITPYSYSWSGIGVGTDPRTGLAAGTYTVTVTDGNSCSATNSTTITQPTAIVVPGGVTNVLCFGASTGAINLSVSGGIPGYSYSWSGTGTGTDPRTNLAAGTYTVTVTDVNMCTQTNSFTVTQPGGGITIVPTVTNATCGASNGSISLVVSGGNTPYSYNWSGTGTGSNPRTALAVGTYTVTVTDGNSCSSTISSTVSAPDVIPPTITCPANTIVPAGATCTTILANYTATAVASDNCTANPTKTQSPVAGTVLGLGAQVLTLTATDASNNSATCSMTVTVTDQTAPSLTCPANATLAAGLNCTASLASYTSVATSSDNCSQNLTLTQNPTAGTILNLGATTVTLTASDAAANTATCAFAVTLTDQTAPSITCPANTAVTADLAGNYTLVSFTGAATAMDNCTANPAKTQSPTAGAVLTVGMHILTLTATDGVGLTSTCSFTLTVQPGCAAPTISCPANAVVSAGANCSATLASYTAAATVMGGCGVSTVSQSPVAGTSLSLGAQVITLTATDDLGNTGTCSFTVTVADQTAPSITCPANTTVPAGANCSATLASYTAAATANDNCTANPTRTQSPAVGTTFTGTQVVVLTATDAAGNSANCTFTVTVADQTAPSITCPANTTVPAGANCTTTLASYTAAATANDNCTASPTKTQSPVAGTTFTGTQVVVLTATDAAGNSANCSFTVTVSDQTAPSITCPANTTVPAGANCTATLASYTSAATANDNCTASPTKTQSPVAGTTFTGTQVVVLTATDAAGNSANCTFTVTVADQTAPSITCPANTTVPAGANCSATLASYTAAATANDNCTASPTKTQSPVAGTTFTGTQVVVLTATDAAGNSANCTFTVTVSDQTAPSITCPANTTVPAGANCTATLASYTAAATANDNCTASPTKTQSPVAGTTFTGTQVVVLTATDAAGNSANCSFTVTVSDQTAPSITCPANTTVPAGANCTATLASYTAAATANDNCTASPTKTQSPVAGTTFTGTQVVVLTATDAAGNSANCSFTVTVADQTAPSITCPANTTVPAGANCSATLASYTAAATANDNCTANPTKTQSPAVGTTFTGTQVVVLTATDAAGNSANCSFTVTVADQTAPSITCPANTTVPAGANCAATLASYTAAATANDNCTANPTKTQSPAAGTTFTGTQVVVLTATDAAGNSANCSFTVTVADQTAPSITCPANTTVPAGANCAAILASYTAAATANDNCTANPTKTQSPAAGTTFTGTQVVVLTATDAAGNSANCSFTVTVADQTAPSITCPANTTVPAGANCAATLASYTAAATANDNCTASPTKTQSPAAGTTITGTQVVVLTATDAAGNSANCSFTVTVADQTAPSITCPANTTVPAGANCSATLASYTAAATANDNCTANPTKTQSPAVGTTFTGTQVVVLTATDAAGNSANCSFTVTVADQTAPSITCPANTTVPAGANCTATLAEYASSATAMDNCTASPTKTQSPGAGASITGTQVVTLTATDGAGNSSTCAFTVTVVDQTAPSITCPANTTTPAGANCLATLANYAGSASAADNCTASPAKTQNPVAGASVTGTQVVTLTATDAAGNSGTCSFTVTVVDQTAPSIICKPATVAISGAGNASVTTAAVFQSGMDNCGTVNLVSVTPNTFTCGNIGTNSVTLTANDGNGNTSTCSATVTVVDNTAPTVVCKNATVTLNAAGSASITTASVFQSGTDNCGTVNQVSVTPGAFTCANVGATTVTLTVNDGHGNNATCTATVTVLDAIAPTMICKPATLTLNAQGQATLTVAQVNDGSFDNCGINVISVSPINFTCNQVGNTTVTLSGVDLSGNKGTCSTTVTVVDAIVPVALCKNLTLNLPVSGSVTLTTAQINNGSSDNCTFSMTLTPSTLNCSDLGNTTVVLRATDLSGNSATCASVVTLRDLAGPVAQCKNATIFLDDVGQATLSVAQVDNGSYDNCGIATKTLSQTQFNCSELQGSSWPVILTLTDMNNNTSSCLSYVTVKDLIAPEAVCEDITVSLTQNGTVTVYGAVLAAESTDNCSVWTYSPVAKVYTSANIGDNALSITVRDYANNPSTCVSVVTVLSFQPLIGSGGSKKQVVTTHAMELALFPNPTSGDATLAFELPEAQPFVVQVFDLTGRLVFHREYAGVAGENRESINLSGIAPGVYHVDLQSEGLKAQKRLVVQE